MKEILISELSVEKLLEASKQLVREKHIPIQTAIMNSSPILNPALASHPSAIIFDFDGLKYKLAECEERFAGDIERLREKWERIEYQCRTRGKKPERTVESLADMSNDDIAEIVIHALVDQKEVKKLSKKVNEIETRENANRRNRRLYSGSVQRARKGLDGIFQISRADGMDVNEEGIIEELGIHVDEYLAECKKRKQKRSAV